jgi:hypothetical protein
VVFIGRVRALTFERSTVERTSRREPNGEWRARDAAEALPSLSGEAAARAAGARDCNWQGCRRPSPAQGLPPAGNSSKSFTDDGIYRPLRRHRSARCYRAASFAGEYSQAHKGCYRAAFPAGGGHTCETLVQDWEEAPQCFLQPEFRRTRDEGHANLAGGHRHYIDLAALAPIDLHVAGPGRDCEVLPVSIWPRVPRERIERRATVHHR